MKNPVFITSYIVYIRDVPDCKFYYPARTRFAIRPEPEPDSTKVASQAQW